MNHTAVFNICGGKLYFFVCNMKDRVLLCLGFVEIRFAQGQSPGLMGCVVAFVQWVYIQLTGRDVNIDPNVRGV